MRAIVVLAILASFSIVSAQVGLDIVKVPDGSIGKVTTEIEARVENWGYHRIFVAIPSGWEPNAIETYVKSYPVRETGLWRIYGMPYDRRSLLGSGQVFTGKGVAEAGFPTKFTTQVGDRYGWWLKPNEGIIIKLKVDDIGSSGTVDPQLIEEKKPGIKVIRWYQRFTLEVTSPGFITAPWVVEGAALTEASPAPYGSSKAEIYFQEYTPEIATPAWEEWAEFRNPLSSLLSPISLAPIDLEFYPIEEEEVTVKPIFRVDNIADIVYAYEWKRRERVEGITLWRDELLLAGVPEWFEWF